VKILFSPVTIQQLLQLKIKLLGSKKFLPPDVSPGGRQSGEVLLHCVLPCAKDNVFQINVLINYGAVLEEDLSVHRVHLHVHALKVSARENPLARREKLQQLKTK
jgi:hypothetical protein